MFCATALSMLSWIKSISTFFCPPQLVKIRSTFKQNRPSQIIQFKDNFGTFPTKTSYLYKYSWKTSLITYRANWYSPLKRGILKSNFKKISTKEHHKSIHIIIIHNYKNNKEIVDYDETESIIIIIWLIYNRFLPFQEKKHSNSSTFLLYLFVTN